MGKARDFQRKIGVIGFLMDERWSYVPDFMEVVLSMKPEKKIPQEKPQLVPELDTDVNHPSHYNMGNIEVIDVIEDWALDFHLGNAVKYIARAQYKGNEVKDLQKAVWYLIRRLELLEGIHGDSNES